MGRGHEGLCLLDRLLKDKDMKRISPGTDHLGADLLSQKDRGKASACQRHASSWARSWSPRPRAPTLAPRARTVTHTHRHTPGSRAALSPASGCTRCCTAAPAALAALPPTCGPCGQGVARAVKAWHGEPTQSAHHAAGRLPADGKRDEGKAPAGISPHSCSATLLGRPPTRQQAACVSGSRGQMPTRVWVETTAFSPPNQARV